MVNFNVHLSGTSKYKSKSVLVYEVKQSKSVQTVFSKRLNIRAFERNNNVRAYLSFYTHSLFHDIQSAAGRKLTAAKAAEYDYMYTYSDVMHSTRRMTRISLQKTDKPKINLIG